MGDEDPEETVGSNWLKKSADEGDAPQVQLAADEDDGGPTRLDIGINGETFGLGPLSKRMFDAIMSVATKSYTSGNEMSDETARLYLEYSMDASAKQAAKFALDGNEYVMDLGDDEAMEDMGAWGKIESVQLEGSDVEFDSFADAINGGWTPGQAYSFVIRGIPCRRKAMDLTALLNAMDPDGALRAEAKEKGIMMPDEDVASLNDLAIDCKQRVNGSPVEATDEVGVFRGGESQGYNVISRSSLLKASRNVDGTENQSTLLHVMDALANHGCLIVDLTDGGDSLEDASKMSKMWDTTGILFDKVINDEDARNSLPGMQEADGVGSSHAMVGFGSFKDGDNQFLETRMRRADGQFLPEEALSVIGEDGGRNMIESFKMITEIGKDVVRIVTAASSVEAEAFLSAGSVFSEEEEGSPSIAGLSFEEASVSGIIENDDDDSEPQMSKEDFTRAAILASEAAALLTEEILDDGRPMRSNDIECNEGTVSMSPHRMCRYSNSVKASNKKQSASEIFGAHTDTTFTTLVPAAAVSGLEVFDEDSLQWYRPELYARKHSKRLDPKAELEGGLPWHSRYLIVMPGELLQLISRNNVPAAVHRVVGATNDSPRLSAPILLRARPGITLDVERYMGDLDKAGSLLLESNGLKMEEIHDALQAPTE